MYASYLELDDFITAIPLKENLCVSRTLGATLSAHNCSTAQLCQSRTSKQIIELSRVNGVTDNAKLIHYFGYFNNHMQNTWFNAIEIGSGSRIGGDLADDLPSFLMYLQITGELMNVYSWVSDTCSISTLPFILANTHKTFVLTSKLDRSIYKEIN